MTAAGFTAWRQLMNLNRTQAAEALGLSRNMPAKYEAGIAPVPRYVALACAALLAGIEPYTINPQPPG